MLGLVKPLLFLAGQKKKRSKKEIMASRTATKLWTVLFRETLK
jgi:hypothetical protein